jgi:hypothetical protein
MEKKEIVPVESVWDYCAAMPTTFAWPEVRKVIAALLK